MPLAFLALTVRGRFSPRRPAWFSPLEASDIDAFSRVLSGPLCRENSLQGADRVHLFAIEVDVSAIAWRRFPKVGGHMCLCDHHVVSGRVFAGRCGIPGS